MLVPMWVASVLAWSAGGAIIVTAMLGARRFLKNERPLLALLMVPVALFGLLLAVSRWANGTRVLIVQADPAGRALRLDLRLYGAKEYRFRDGSVARLTMSSGRHLVVNDTSSPLTLEHVRYGYGVSTSQRIAPFSAHPSGIITNFGPQDPPPAKIQTTEYGGERFWLRW